MREQCRHCHRAELGITHRSAIHATIDPGSRLVDSSWRETRVEISLSAGGESQQGRRKMPGALDSDLPVRPRDDQPGPVRRRNSEDLLLRPGPSGGFSF